MAPLQCRQARKPGGIIEVDGKAPNWWLRGHTRGISMFVWKSASRHATTVRDVQTTMHTIHIAKPQLHHRSPARLGYDYVDMSAIFDAGLIRTHSLRPELLKYQNILSEM
jgi:hypothetical protein